MALIPLYEAKTYLRVDSSDEDALIGILLSSAEQMCKDVGRLSEDQWEAVNAADRDAENGVQPTRELEALRSTCRVAILYALGYLYEHRDEADQRHIRHVLYNCVASRPSIEGETNEDSKEVKTDTLNLQATPLANGYVKAKTGTNTTDDVYNKWYDAVYEPQAEAVDTEDTSHTEEPQG